MKELRTAPNTLIKAGFQDWPTIGMKKVASFATFMNQNLMLVLQANLQVNRVDTPCHGLFLETAPELDLVQ